MHRSTSAADAVAKADVALVRGRIEVRVTGKLSFHTVGVIMSTIQDGVPPDMVDAPLLYDLRAVEFVDQSAAEALITVTVLASLAETHPVAFCSDSKKARRGLEMVTSRPQEWVLFSTINSARGWLRDRL